MSIASGPPAASRLPLPVPAHPVRVAFAVGFALLLAVWTDGIDSLPFRATNSLEFYELGDRLLTLVALVLAAVPLVALRWTALAGALALAPLLLSVVGETGVPITVYVALVLGGAVAWQRSRPAGVALAGLGVVVCAPVMLVPWSQFAVYSTINVDWRYDSDGTVTLLLYAVAAGLVLALAEAARRSASRSAELRAREGRLTQDVAVLDERARLARDLHDVVAHHVSLIAVRAETAPYTVEDLGRGGRTVLADIADDARHALDELRGVLGVLRRASDDPALAPQPTAGDLPALVQRAADAGEQVTWAEPPVGLGDVPAAAGYAGYRVVQEALTNARRHAPGRPVGVSAAADGEGGLRLRVVCDVGRPVAEPVPGRGLAGARERVEALGGRFSAGPVADAFVVAVELPASRG